MKCPICSGENENNAAFCTFCGTALQDSTSGFMDGIDTSNLDLDSQLNNGFGKRNTGEQTVVQQPQQPSYQQPKQSYQQPKQPAYQQTPVQNTNDPYAANSFNAAQNNAGYAQRNMNYQQPYSQNAYGQQGYAQQPYQATSFQQNNAAFNDPANGFANPSYSGFGMGRAGGAVRKKSHTGVLIAIIILIGVIAFFVYSALKYSKKNAEDKLYEMKCISVKMSSNMEKNDDFSEESFLGRYDPSVMDVTTEFYEDGDDSAFVYMKLSYPTLTASDLSGTDASTFLNLWVQQMRSKDSQFKNLSTSEDEDNDKASLITMYDAKRVYLFAACRQEGNAFYFSMFMCNEKDRDDYEDNFRKWDKTLKITG